MKSYVYVKISGKNINNFLLKLRRNNINILKIKHLSYKEIIVLINAADYEKMLKIKSTYNIELISNKGFLKFKELFLRYRTTLFSFAFGIILLIFLSNIIFSVNIVTDNNELKLELKNELKSYKINRFSLKKNYDKISKIKEEILKSHKDNIEWLEISEYGTSYIVKVVERKKNPQKSNDNSTNIVAGKSGVIKSIIADSGEKIVEEENYINKGDIVISGTIMLNDSVKAYVKSEGKVYAETWYNVKISYPLKYKEKKYTNNKKKIVFFKVSDNYYEIFKFKNNERNDLISYNNKLIPFSFGIEEIREIKIIDKKYSLKEAKSKALKLAKDKVLQKLDEDAYIINEKTLNFSSNGSKIEMDIFISAYENIAKEVENNIENNAIEEE